MQVTAQLQELKACERPTDRNKWAWYDKKLISQVSITKRKDLNIRKEENSFTAVCTEQWEKFQCHSCHRLAQNKRKPSAGHTLFQKRKKFTDIQNKHKVNNIVKEIIHMGRHGKDNLDRMGEERWLKIAMNYKTTGQIVRGRSRRHWREILGKQG
jgi:hypothetical protein